MQKIAPRLALASSAAALILAACTSSPDRDIAGPSASINKPTVSHDFGAADVALINVCIDPASPAGPYTASFTTPTNYYSVQPEDMTNAYTMNDILQSSPQTGINPGECRLLFTKVHGQLSDPNNPQSLFLSSFTTITVTNTGQSGGSFSYICTPDAKRTDFCSGDPIPNDPDLRKSGTGNVATNGANPFHGSTVTFSYTPPSNQVALFVIGDVEAHGIGTSVNFWGSQWWKNNIMSQFTSNGYPSFKGYANLSDNRCGGTWTSLPGNSSVPPKTIPADVAIIVTSNVWKNGPNISGNIKEIVMVHQDGKYGPNPGHDGNGPVTSVVCTSNLP